MTFTNAKKQVKSYGTIQEIDNDLSILTKLLKTEQNKALKEMLHNKIDHLLELRQKQKNQDDAIEKLPDIQDLATKLGNGNAEDGWEKLLKNSFCVGPIDD